MYRLYKFINNVMEPSLVLLLAFFKVMNSNVLNFQTYKNLGQQVKYANIQ